MNTGLFNKPENRITAALKRVEEVLKTADEEKIKRLTAASTLSSQEFFAYQQQQSQAHASGILTLDEAQMVYRVLGGEFQRNTKDGWPKDTKLAMKIVVTQFMGQLIGATHG